MLTEQEQQQRNLRFIKRLREVHGLKRRSPERIKQEQINRTNAAINRGLT